MIKSIESSILGSAARLFVVLILLFLPSFSSLVFAQGEIPPTMKATSKDDKDETPASFGEMLVKQQISRRKKEHDELLKRGDEALKLSKELEDSFAASETFTSQDVTKLQALEKVVSKIRSDLGGDDDDETVVVDEEIKEQSAKRNIVDAFRFLQESTKQLVDEIKKTTRFSISAAAIQTSNTVIRFARFLRLKK